MALSQIMWPLTLPQDPLVDGYKVTPGRAVIQSEFDMGPKRQRKRSSAAMSKVSATYYLKKSQKAVWDAFYELSLGRSFWWPDPVADGSYVYARLSADPELVPRGPNWFSLSVELEVWPYITATEMDMGNTVVGLSLTGPIEGAAGTALEYSATASSAMMNGQVVRYRVTFNGTTFDVASTGTQGTLVDGVATFTILVPTEAEAGAEYVLSVEAFDNYGGHTASPATATITVTAAVEASTETGTDTGTETNGENV